MCEIGLTGRKLVSVMIAEDGGFHQMSDNATCPQGGGVSLHFQYLRVADGVPVTQRQQAYDGLGAYAPRRSLEPTSYQSRQYVAVVHVQARFENVVHHLL